MARLMTAQEDRLQRAITTDAAAMSEMPVEVNEKGFMVDPSQWSPAAALYLARRQGLDGWPRELTADHWSVIDYTRAYFQATDNAPSLRYTCRALGLTRKRFSWLFPGGLITVRRIAGLPGGRRPPNGSEKSLARELWARNWWGQLTSVEPRVQPRAEATSWIS